MAGDDLEFAGTARTGTQNDFPDGTLFGSIEIAANGFTLAGSPLTLTGGLTVDSGVGSATLSADVALDGSQTFDVEGTWLTDSGVLSGSGSLVKTGPGTFELTGGNTYSGGTTIRPACSSSATTPRPARSGRAR